MTDRTRFALRRILPFLLLALQPIASGAEAASGQLDWLMGRWTGGGTSFGAPSEASLEIAPTLDGAFVELRYRLIKPAAFEGRAFYRKGVNADWEGRWFDSRGIIFPIGASVSKDAMTSNWGTPETERGRTVYRLLADGRLEVVDDVLGRDGRWREFARQTFMRAP